MSFTDPVADLLTRVRNAQHALHQSVQVSHSKLKESVVKVLKEEGFIENYEVVAVDNVKKNLVVELKYFQGKPVIKKIIRVSTPGKRVYANIQDLPRYYNGLGLIVLSTSHGVLADHKARDLNVGGEVLCKLF